MKRLMKKRMLWMVIATLFTITTLIGCQRASSKGDASLQQKETATNEYPYVQEVQILEDNYRNYYEIFVYSFYDSDGDGIGDIQGVIEKLDYINDGDNETHTDMGFNGIWLMPIMPSSTYHKYDVKDYYEIDPEYGNLDDFKELLAECDKRNIKLIIDLVFNHTSAKHTWFLEAVEYLKTLQPGEEPDLEQCPYVGYYNFEKDITPNDAWKQVAGTDWYYECVFWDQMPDLKLENPLVREEIENIASFWLELGVGGFRLDAAKEFYTGNVEKNIEVLNWFTQYVTSVQEDAYIVAEVWDSLDTIEKYYQSGITSLFNFPLSQREGKIVRMITGQDTALSWANAMVTIDEKYSKSNPNYIDAPFINNHDHGRLSNAVTGDLDKMKLAAGLLMSMNGSPFVYYGEEIGMSSSGKKDENKRLPFIWSTDTTTGITDGPLGSDGGITSKFPSVEEQMEDPLSLLNYYKRSVRIRNENPAIARGETSVITELSNKDVAVVKKEYKGNIIYIAYNVSMEEQQIDFTDVLPEGIQIRGYLTVDDSNIILKDNLLAIPKYGIVYLTIK